MLDSRQGPPARCVVNLDNILTVSRHQLTRLMGVCDATKVEELNRAVKVDLEVPGSPAASYRRPATANPFLTLPRRTVVWISGWPGSHWTPFTEHHRRSIGAPRRMPAPPEDCTIVHQPDDTSQEPREVNRRTNHAAVSQVHKAPPLCLSKIALNPALVSWNTGLTACEWNRPPGPATVRAIFLVTMVSLDPVRRRLFSRPDREDRVWARAPARGTVGSSLRPLLFSAFFSAFPAVYRSRISTVFPPLSTQHCILPSSAIRIPRHAADAWVDLDQ